MAKAVKKIEKPDFSTIESEKDLGKFIQYKRTKQNLTIQELADICNINYRTIDSLEKGKGVRLSSALYIAKMVGLKLEVKE